MSRIGVVVRQFLCLLVDGVGHFGAAIADVDAIESRERIDVALALMVFDANALCARHDLARQPRDLCCLRHLRIKQSHPQIAQMRTDAHRWWGLASITTGAGFLMHHKHLSPLQESLNRLRHWSVAAPDCRGKNIWFRQKARSPPRHLRGPGPMPSCRRMEWPRR